MQIGNISSPAHSYLVAAWWALDEPEFITAAAVIIVSFTFDILGYILQSGATVFTNNFFDHAFMWFGGNYLDHFIILVD